MQQDSSPWYKHFWPWFIICLMGTAMTASLITVYIAIDGSDDVVSDTYYKDGLAINQLLDQDKLASELGLTAQITLGSDATALVLTSQFDLPEQVVLKLLHPASDELDQNVFLFHEGNGQYRGAGTLPDQRYYVQLTGSDNGRAWRLSGEYRPGLAVLSLQ
jgi:uncharacterized protein